MIKLQPMNVRTREKEKRQRVGEIWIQLSGMGYAIQAQNLEDDGDKVTFTRYVEGKDGSKRTDRITAAKQHVIFIAETIEAD